MTKVFTNLVSDGKEYRPNIDVYIGFTTSMLSLFSTYNSIFGTILHKCVAQKDTSRANEQEIHFEHHNAYTTTMNVQQVCVQYE